jgi:flagellar motor switch protein FliN/FliY
MELPEPAQVCCEISFDEENSALFVISEEILTALGEFFKKEEEQKASSNSNSDAATILDNPNLQQILNTNLDITILYGSTEMKISEILNVNNTSIIELDKHSNEPVDIYINGKIFAHGEIVVIEKNYGIVVKKIISVKDRILNLKE